MINSVNAQNFSNSVSKSNLNFNSIICPEREKDFIYLSKYFKLKIISDEKKKEDLLKIEKYFLIYKIFLLN